ncbi:MAG: thymidine kinase [Thermoleophilia bacterium]|nr:thymidine kinase [Thermoleophilia bacterium]
MIRNHPSCGGWIEAICGPMFSGKSEELIRRLRRAEIAGQAVMIAKPISDDRYDLSHVVSHSGHRIRAAGIEDPGALAPLAAEYDVLGIDEVQFFPGSVVEVCVALADRGVRVIAAGLDMDYRAEPFGPMPELLARADMVDKLQAVCVRCGGPATLSQRLIDGRPAPWDGETVMVGAHDAYEARCRGCYERGDAAAGVGGRGHPSPAPGPDGR